MLSLLDFLELGALVAPCVAVVALAVGLRRAWRLREANKVRTLVLSHLGDPKLPQTIIASREFPYRCRADLQLALDGLFRELGADRARFFGVEVGSCADGLSLRDSLGATNASAWTAAPEYEDVDVGEAAPVRCAKSGLWLIDDGGIRYAVLLSALHRYRPDPVALRFQVASRDVRPDVAAATSFFARLEAAVARAEVYRGKILSLEQDLALYSGQGCGIKVHKLDAVDRDDVILPAAILDLLDRNVIDFVRRRAGLRRLGQCTKKGLLFYGPPGVGKTHTIRYLAQSLPGHTTLLISAEQMSLLDEYMTLARLLQPSLVVIEDVDLIARAREEMHNPCQESLLNKLLNHMDGLTPQSDVLFILTTNRPESLEQALAARPGRVDQAIEFPLPDAACRRKLAKMYSEGARPDEEAIERIVDRTDRVSAAFIKELMRRSAEYCLERQGRADGSESRAESSGAPRAESSGQPVGDAIEIGDVDSALEDLLRRGGSLNLKLLGAMRETEALAV